MNQKRAAAAGGAIALLAFSLTSCGSSSSDSGKTGAGPAAAASSTPAAAAADTSCAGLAGKPVADATSCGDFDAPASAGCYPGGAKDGSLLYFLDSSGAVFGKTGGTWQSGPAAMSIADMAKAVGC